MRIKYSLSFGFYSALAYYNYLLLKSPYFCNWNTKWYAFKEIFLNYNLQFKYLIEVSIKKFEISKSKEKFKNNVFACKVQYEDIIKEMKIEKYLLQ